MIITARDSWDLLVIRWGTKAAHRKVLTAMMAKKLAGCSLSNYDVNISS